MFSILKAYAASGSSSFDSVLSKITTEIVEPINLLISTAALLYFLWGVYEFVKGADSSGSRDTGVQHMVWGLFGLVLTISVQAFISVIKNSFGL